MPMGNLLERNFYRRVPIDSSDEEDPSKDPSQPSPFAHKSSFHELRTFLKPYYWPSDRANQIKCLGTWVMVASSKICNISSPLFLSYATNSIIENHYQTASLYLLGHCAMRFFAIFFQGFFKNRIKSLTHSPFIGSSV